MLPDSLLAQVQRPARYIGGEFNAVRKDLHTVDLRVALCYPDVYEVGMSHVGLQILYHVLNQRPDTACERVFHPDADAAAALRQAGLPLCALESGDPLAAFDLLGITLQYELTYATLLSVLELAGLPLLWRERGPQHPLILAGGPGALNPEPLADFFDAFALGDGEEVVHEIAEAVLSTRGLNREHTLAALAQVPGVYVPAVHDPATARIERRIVADLDAADYPTRPVVPFVEIVHDRAQVEAARGCTRGCRFCQAGMIYRPVRERRSETLRRQAREIISATGYDEVSVVSLNCPDYTEIAALVDGLHADLGHLRVSVGLPSLRIDGFSVELARRVQRVRKSGLTFAPEAGSQRLRDAINKGVTEDDLLRTAEAAFQAGWQTLKLYFMLGLPTETDEDVLAIADLVKAVARVGRQTLGSRAGRMKLNVSVATLVPKAHTPMQWEGQLPRAEIERRQRLLRDALRDRQVALSCHDPRQSVVEAALARGTRRTAPALLNAFRAGAMLDGWKERFDYGLWQRAFGEAGLDPELEAARSFELDRPLPWEHVDAGVSREFLLAERARMLAGTPTPDCRQAGCRGCGVRELAECPVVPETAPAPVAPDTWAGAPA